MSSRRDNAIALYMEGIRDGHVREAVETYTGSRYTQHSTGVADGVEGFVAFFEPFIARTPQRDIRIVRSIEDGNHVFLHVYQNLNDGEAEWVTTDFFDTDDQNRIIEHWDVIAPFLASTPSGHSSIDGPTVVVDHHATENNKAIVRELITQAWMPDGDPARAGELAAETCIEHAERDPSLVYDEIVLLLGEGNFVATLCRANSNGRALCQADLFRLDAGKIVEHWENSEPVPEHDINSGKF